VEALRALLCCTTAQAGLLFVSLVLLFVSLVLLPGHSE
jgi:hypothetical protein